MVNDGLQAAGRVTLAHVAADAGVSRATASLVLRDSPLVAGETRQRVRDSMERLGYVYHRGAASLRARLTHTAGLVVTDLANPFFAEMTMGVEERLEQAGHVVLLGASADAPQKQERLITAMHEYGADGLLLCPADGTPRGTLERLRRWRLPVVLVTRYLPGSDADYVGADNVAGAAMGTEHLLALGHRRIAFIGGPAHSSARSDRLRGFRDAMARRGLSVDETLLLTAPPTRDGGYHAIAELLARPNPPSAALCYNDAVALGAMLGVRAAGLVPGRDLAVVGFDDVAEAALARPALTTLAITPRRLGAEAAGLLHERIARPDDPPRRVVLSPTLVVRESCGAHPRRERVS